MANPNDNAVGAVEGVRSNKYYIVSPVSYFHTELPVAEPKTMSMLNVARQANYYSGESTGLNPIWAGNTLLEACQEEGSCANTYAYNPITKPTRMFCV